MRRSTTRSDPGDSHTDAGTQRPVDWWARVRMISASDAVSWPSWWVTTGMVITFQVVGTHAVGRAASEIPARIGTVVVAQAAMFALLLIVVRPVLRIPRIAGARRRWVLVIAMFALAGAFRAVISGHLMGLVATAPVLPVGNRMLSSGTTAAVALTFTAVIVGLVREQATEQVALANDQSRLAHLRTDAMRNLELAHQTLLEGIRSSLTSNFRAVQLGTSEHAADELRATVNQVVRPISHELAVRIPIGLPTPAELATPRVNWRETSRRATAKFGIFPTSTALAAGYLGLAVLGGIYGAGTGLALALLNGLCLWVALLAARALLVRIRPARLGPSQAWCGTLLLIAAVTVVELALLSITFRTSHPWTLLFGSVIILPILGWLMNLMVALLRRQALVTQELAEVSEAVKADMVRIREVQWARRSTLAMALHGPVQSVITAAAIRLDLAKASGHPEDLDLVALKQEILESIDRLGSDPGSNQRLCTAISRLQVTWRGICRLSLTEQDDVQQELDRQPDTSRAVLEIIHEACANAVRHAGATEIAILVSIATSPAWAIEVEVADNGSCCPQKASQTASASRPAAPGLGTAILDELTLRWSRTVTERGSTLTATIPMVLVGEDRFRGGHATAALPDPHSARGASIWGLPQQKASALPRD